MNKLNLLYYISEFVLFYLVKLVQSNIYMAYVILSPKMKTNPGFMEVPLRLRTSAGLLLFSSLISMTPGTLSVDISDDKKTMLVHVLLKDDDKKIHCEIDNIQKRVQRLIG